MMGWKNNLAKVCIFHGWAYRKEYLKSTFFYYLCDLHSKIINTWQQLKQRSTDLAALAD